MLTGGEDNMQRQVSEYSCREHTMENSMILRVLPLNICGTCVLYNRHANSPPVPWSEGLGEICTQSQVS